MYNSCTFGKGVLWWANSKSKKKTNSGQFIN